MNYAGYIVDDIANGIGIRTSVFVSGCRNNCPGCFNKEQQDFNYGEKFTDEVIDYILDSINTDYHAGLSILGGDPMEPENAEGLRPLIDKFKERYPKKDIWTYTGYIFEDILALPDEDSRKYLLLNTNILVDGRFILEKKRLGLKFRGSSNQRIIKVQESIEKGYLVQYRI